MKLNCLIVDDEPLAIDVMVNYISRLEYLHLTGRCRSAFKASTFLNQGKVDLLLLDIQMPDMDGFALLRSLEKPPMVIFTTASIGFAVESYEFNAIDYLVKPISFERFLKAVNKACQKAMDKKATEGLNAHLLVKAENKTYKIDPREIQFAESIHDHVVLHLVSGEKITSYTSLANLTDQLPSGKFIRIHRSYLVAIDHIKAFSTTQVEIGREILPIGRTYKDEVLNRFQ